jgi:hypothetical protein
MRVKKQIGLRGLPGCISTCDRPSRRVPNRRGPTTARKLALTRMSDRTGVPGDRVARQCSAVGNLQNDEERSDVLFIATVSQQRHKLAMRLENVKQYEPELGQREGRRNAQRDRLQPTFQ